MNGHDNSLVHEIAYSEAVRALSEQHGVIDSFRTRAGLLLSSAAVTTSFLAGQAIHGGRVGVFGWLALLTFAAVATLALAAIGPRHWEIGAHPDETTDAYLDAERQDSAGDLHRAMTFRLRQAHLANRAALERLAVFLQMASSLLAAEVIIWILAIATAP